MPSTISLKRRPRWAEIRILFSTNDAVMLSATFCLGVVRYSKPFIESAGRGGKRRYPIRHLKKVAGFDEGVHRHLIELRNTLIAHDDFESIEPRILTAGLTLENLDFTIPTTIAVSNKCIAYPNDTGAVRRFHAHTSACITGVQEKLNDDMARVRAAALANPADARTNARYERNYGAAVPLAGVELRPPDFMASDWLNAGTPDFSQVHNGFHYEELRARRDFHGPERIELPDGNVFELRPGPLPPH
jgi:hypothetical protein